MQASIALSNATRGFDKLYTYSIPQIMANSIQIGALVKVPFGYKNKLVIGLVIAFDLNESISKYKIKEIAEITDSTALTENQLSLVSWMRERYICTYFDAIKCLSPSYSTENSKTIRMASLCLPVEIVQKDISDLKVNRIQQVKVLELLIDFVEIPVSQLLSQASVSASVVNTLMKNGYVSVRTIKGISESINQKGLGDQAKIAFEPTSEQKEIINKIKLSARNGRNDKYLIHGVTGSGKTEVYLQVIDEIIRSGKSAVVLVPEISLTPLMIGRFEARFPGEISVLHSRMSPSQKRASWRKISNGESRIVIGARSAVFAPVKNLGIIIIDEEHESTYRSETNPKYNAIEVADFICSMESACLVLGSATPSLETYYKAMNSEYELLVMKTRTSKNGLPFTKIIDMRKELENGNTSVFSFYLQDQIISNMESKMQTMLFLNRRGFSSFVICRDCGFVVKCKDCSVSMTYHKPTNNMICHYCGRIEKNPVSCPDCSSSKIRFFGSGTQKIEEELKKINSKLTTIRMDMDTTTGRGDHEKILEKFESENINVMVGTQMIIKGHDFEKVTLVGILAADSSLYSPDYRATERTFQQITQASGRAGRGDFKGKVIIQTYNPDHSVILSSSKQDYLEFYNSEILVRKALRYPPFCNIGCIIVHGINFNETLKVAQEVSNEVKKFVMEYSYIDFDVIGPNPSPSAKLRGRNRIRIILKYENIESLIKVLTNISDWFYNKKHSEIDLSVDINPFNMV
ncbi:MAG: primosomal protein N' [Bacillota bacterium]